MTFHNLYELVALAAELGILWYVYKEYAESHELNQKLAKIYRAKQKKINADKVVKAVIAQEAAQVK